MLPRRLSVRKLSAENRSALAGGLSEFDEWVSRSPRQPKPLPPRPQIRAPGLATLRSLPSILVCTSTQAGLRLMGGDGLPHLALFGAYIGLASVRRRQAEPGESRARQLNGTAAGGQGEKTDKRSRSGDSNHVGSVTNKRGQTLKTSETTCGDQDRIAARIW